MSEKSSKIREFTDLVAWQEAYNLTIEVYKITKTFPPEERFGLTSQMRRSAVSVASNIAEGFGRRTATEKVRFYDLSHGSLTELKNQILIAEGVGHIDQIVRERLFQQAGKAHRLLQGLIAKMRS